MSYGRQARAPQCRACGENWVKPRQIVGGHSRLMLRERWDDGDLNMKPIAEDDRRAIARRLFEALCALYPDRYVALSEKMRE
jgi:hypothetical protein